MAARPNILFIMADDHASKAIGCYGAGINSTPNMDRIAKEGMRFNHCYVTNSICTPSRASILTGTYNHVNGVVTLASKINKHIPNVAKHLRTGGYQTAMIGKWHLGEGSDHEPSGFDFWSVVSGQGSYHDPEMIEMGKTRYEKGYATDIITDKSLDWLKGHLYTEDVKVPETFDDDYKNRARAAQWLGSTSSPLRKYWCRLHRTLNSSSSGLNRFQTMFCLATMAYSTTISSQAVQALAAFVNISSVGQVNIPNFSCLHLREGRKVEPHGLAMALRGYLKPLSSCPESDLSRLPMESKAQFNRRRRRLFEGNQAEALKDFVNTIKAQWIRDVPQTPSDSNIGKYINVSMAMECVREKWERWYQNHLFYKYLKNIAKAIRQCSVIPIPVPGRQVDTTPAPGGRQVQRFVIEENLFQNPVPSLPGVRKTTPDLLPVTSEGRNGDEIANFVNRLKNLASRVHEQNYAEDLQKSLGSLLKNQGALHSITQHGESLHQLLRQNFSHCQDDVDAIYQSLRKAILPNGKSSPTMYMAPRVCPIFFLQQLTRKRWGLLSLEWKKAIVTYGLAITNLQQAERMLEVHSNKADFLKELLNPGHTNWTPLDYPESLLLEVESGIMIREVQENIASKMREPPNNANAVMQLNMGEGKSSVIVPIVAAHLADGAKLVRVVVAKPQAKELYRTLMLKLGGLLNHRIYQMPFSRSLRLTTAEASKVDEIYRECMNEGGVLLIQQEHILSFKLMGIECQLSGREDVGRILLSTQHFFDLHSQDIVDECDENFNVKFELVYTMGTQNPVELSPERWTLIQQVLGIVASIAPSVREQLPESIEVTHHSEGRFPRTRILRQDAHDLLLKRVAQEICETGLAGFPLARQSRQARETVFAYISCAQLSPDQIDSVEQNATFFTESSKGLLLLLRGLIAEGVLGFTLGQRRWRVNYGLTSTRQPNTRLAIPYRAKDNPTARSEFSHPDIVIVLTCLSYYYGGLTDDDLFLAFDHLIKSDQADIEYHEWVKDASNLPASFNRLIGVNMKDRFQAANQIFPHLRFTKSVIDYFLAHFVFPKEMREFPPKLSASGWDIGQKKVHPTTGFSGTNDSHHLLPLDVTHLDLEEQQHTNALVLGHLLQAENAVDYLSRPKDNMCSDAEVLLNLVTSMEHPVQVILDVGAQILELTNLQVAQTWLKMIPPEQRKEAVVFFNDYDDLCVVDRKGCVEQFQTSPYSAQLDVCLVFLDEAHTRGTDLKLPEYYRAAVTLGANLTKDRLVQACMRMRKLGKGQSVVFCVPEEIQSKIYEVTHNVEDVGINVSDVLLWSISETFSDIRRSIPLWAMQGARFDRQREFWTKATSSTGIQLSTDQAKQFLENEAQTLEYRYKPIPTSGNTDNQLRLFPNSEGSTLLSAIWKRCEMFDCLHFKSSALHEEQERELSPEVEQERQVERPHPAEPEAHSVHPDVIHFISTGKVPFQSIAFIPAFHALKNTSITTHFDINELKFGILVTVDYMKTVKLQEGENQSADSYQRQIQWILTSTDGGQTVQRLVIISPHEAQELLPALERSNFVSLHLYAARPNLSWPALDTLDLYTVSPPVTANWQLPNSLRLQLNLFTGQLYFKSFPDYKETCEMLQLAWKAIDEGVTVRPDGFIVEDLNNPRPRFGKSPVKFLMVLLMNIRRDCEGIGKSHWGRVLGGEIMRESDFAQT